MKKITMLLFLISIFLVACSSNDNVKQVTYEGEGSRSTWRAELEYQEELREDGQINVEIILNIILRDNLDDAELADNFLYRLKLDDTIVFENTETYDETKAISALMDITGNGVFEHPFPDDGIMMLELEWYGNQEEFQLKIIEEE